MSQIDDATLERLEALWNAWQEAQKAATREKRVKGQVVLVTDIVGPTADAESVAYRNLGDAMFDNFPSLLSTIRALEERVKGMEWMPKGQRPTEEGWYWCVHSGHHNTDADATIHEMVVRTDGARIYGGDNIELAGWYDDAHFCGPVDPPLFKARASREGK